VKDRIPEREHRVDRVPVRSFRPSAIGQTRGYLSGKDLIVHVRSEFVEPPYLLHADEILHLVVGFMQEIKFSFIKEIPGMAFRETLQKEESGSGGTFRKEYRIPMGRNSGLGTPDFFVRPIPVGI
jgi:hypothetical protein